MRSEFLPLCRPQINEDELSAVEEVFKSGHLTTGPKVTEFEAGIEKYLGNSVKAVALNSCTAGLFLALRAYNIKDGDEVILPTWTFAATGHVVLWVGAKPVLCDVEEPTLNIDVRQMKSLITPRTKAIIPVHFAGYPCNMDAIMEVARQKDLVVIEDAAHAIGARYKEEKIGCIGDVTVFSFYATKNLTCGEGGMAVSKSQEVIERIRKLSYFGINKHAFNRYAKTGTWYYEIEELGYKYNMDSIHAAIGLIQLKKLDKMNERRREIAKKYRQLLDRRITLLKDDKLHYHAYHLFPVRLPKGLISRDAFIAQMKERNIGTSVHFIPLHKHPYYRQIITEGSFPVADMAYEEIVSIPMFSGMADTDVDYVIESVNDILRGG